MRVKFYVNAAIHAFTLMEYLIDTFSFGYT